MRFFRICATHYFCIIFRLPRRESPAGETRRLGERFGGRNIKVLRAISCIVILLTLTSCVTRMNNIMKSWEGHHFSELIASWGPPSQILDDGQGGKIYCYQSTTSFTTPGSSHTTGNVYSYGNTATYQGNTTYNAPQTHSYQRHRMFWVNSRGYIYRWSWRGM